jgi:mRNA interferase MazF
MAFQRGDVLLVPFPYSDLSTTKVRPAIVISSALYQALEPVYGNLPL